MTLSVGSGGYKEFSSPSEKGPLPPGGERWSSQCPGRLLVEEYFPHLAPLTYPSFSQLVKRSRSILAERTACPA